MLSRKQAISTNQVDMFASAADIMCQGSVGILVDANSDSSSSSVSCSGLSQAINVGRCF